MKPFLIVAVCIALLAGGAAGAGAAPAPLVEPATYQADLLVAGNALVKLGSTLERNDTSAAIRRQAASLRKQLFTFDRRMYVMSRYRLEAVDVNAHRARVSRAGLAVSAPMSNFLDAVLLGQQARVDRLARTVLARLQAVTTALG